MSDSPNARSIDLMQALPIFAPNSAGTYRDLTALTIIGANQTFPFLCEFLEKTGRKLVDFISSEEFCSDPASRRAAVALQELFDKHGTDKSTHHDYHFVYGELLKEPTLVTAILEIGIGSNNPDMPSTMGAAGRPGASLRAFRDFLPHADVFGADADRRILFEEPRIRTFFVNQIDRGSFGALESQIGQDFDLVIDDGLHAPSANISVLIYAIHRLKVGGWFVVEDIRRESLPIWQIVAALIPAHYRVYLISGKAAFMFAIERLS